MSTPAIVSLGGGHGLHATLTAMRRLSSDVTAVVTVADDGGSSGRLRAELGMIPPGDLRMALAALVEAEGREGDPRARFLAELLQHRIGGRGALAGHPLGNLLLAGLTEMADGDFAEALRRVAWLCQVRGSVVPMSTLPLEIEADVQGLDDDPRLSRNIRGQVAVASTPGKVRRVRLLPDAPPASPDALRAIKRADLITLGPGSWFSSVIPHVLVPEQRAALVASTARRVLLLNLAPELGETSGFSAERHLHVLHAHAPQLRIDDVVVDPTSFVGATERAHLERAAATFGARLHVAEVASRGKHVHDPERVATVVGDLLP